MKNRLLHDIDMFFSCVVKVIEEVYLAGMVYATCAGTGATCRGTSHEYAGYISIRMT